MKEVRDKITAALIRWVDQPDDEEIGELLGSALAMVGGGTEEIRQIAAAGMGRSAPDDKEHAE